MTEDINNPDEPTKDLTTDLTDRQLLLQLRQGMSAVLERLAELEARTNPLPPNYDARFTALEEKIGRMERKLNAMASDVYDVRSAQTESERRLDALESRPS